MNENQERSLIQYKCDSTYLTVNLLSCISAETTLCLWK